jgi:uncharacterized protein YndB with AHSA1/START domain
MTLSALRNRKWIAYFEVTVIAYAAAVLMVMVYADYSANLFVIGPMFAGCVVSHHVRRRDDYAELNLPSKFAMAAVWPPVVLLVAASIFSIVTGFEGLICIIMASPIVFVSMLCGATVGLFAELLISKGHRKLGILVILSCLSLFLFFWENVSASQPGLFRVNSTIIVDAPPETVWKHVVEFSELPKPTDWMFKTGLAYPIRARIEGKGVGAIRYCEFSTGAFVEPITAWEEPHLLAFDVTENPAPMQEFSPHGEIHPPHLEGYMVSKKGQFKLIELSDGRTKLIGSTWYQHGLGPEWYWKLWSDKIIHRIHFRVLNHIKSSSEAG